MTQTLKIAIPTAGWATRLRPQTWSKPKPLVSVAGKTFLDHLLDMFHTVPDLSPVVGMPAGSKEKPGSAEYIIILGPGLGETQIPLYMKEHYPELKTHFALQSVMLGQSDAFYQAREHLTGPVIINYADTLMETDFSFIAAEKADVVVWVKPVQDPRRFGVAELDASGWVTRLIEKPDSMENNLVVVGCYFFKSGEDLVAAFEEQFRRKLKRKGEYFLVDAVNIMIENGARVRTNEIAVWLDVGTIESTLETNRYMLEHGKANKTMPENQNGVRIVPPVFIHPEAKVRDSVIGPYASIGAGCKITKARVEDSILEAGVTVEMAALQGSFIGRQSRVQGHSAGDPPLKLNIGDDSTVTIK